MKRRPRPLQSELRALVADLAVLAESRGGALPDVLRRRVEFALTMGKPGRPPSGQAKTAALLVKIARTEGSSAKQAREAVGQLVSRNPDTVRRAERMYGDSMSKAAELEAAGVLDLVESDDVVKPVREALAAAEGLRADLGLPSQRPASPDDFDDGSG